MYYTISVERALVPKRTYFKRNNRKLRRNVWFATDYSKSLLSTDLTPEPLRILLKPIWESGYAHHIVRLYILSVLIQLFVCPQDIYEWMMFIFADALDYVMLFNVYAMGFFDRRFTRKAYLFSSKYIHD